MKAVLGVAMAMTWGAASIAQPAQDAYHAGVEARLAGDAARAVEQLRLVVAADPGNADAQLQLGLSWLALGRLDEAEAALRHTLDLAPGYHDARIGLARVAQRRGDREAALAELADLPPDHAEAQALRRQLAGGRVAGARWQLSVDASYSFLENQPDWQGLDLDLRYRAHERTSIAIAAQAARRFEINDVYIEARVDQRVSDSAGLYALGGVTPGADFRPEWQIGLGGDWRIRPGADATVLRLDARHAEYPAGDISTLTPGIEQYVPGTGGWITAQWINVFEEDGRHNSGWLARGDLFVAPRLRLFAGLADAPDVSEGVVVETFSIFGGAAWEAGNGHVLRLSLSHEDRAIGSDRLTLGVGLGLSF